MQEALKDYLGESELSAQWQAVESAETLEAMMAAAWALARVLALRLMSQVLEARAAEPVNWPNCTVCGQRLHSKGWRARQWRGGVGTVKWRRRVGRCPRGGTRGQVAPLDRARGLEAQASTSAVVHDMACLLAVLLPFERASRVLARLSGVGVSTSSVWHWVQRHGRAAMAQLDKELERLSQGEGPAPEALAAEVAALPVRVGVEGVKVPLRPHGGDPLGRGGMARGEAGAARAVLPAGMRGRRACLCGQAAPPGRRARGYRGPQAAPSARSVTPAW